MKGYIYKIVDNTNGNIYYGSTIQNVSARLAKHRQDYKNFLNKKKINKCSSSIILENNNYSYYTIEEVNFDNKWELRNRERWYIENNNCVNKCIPNRTAKEYREENSEKIKASYKNWKEDNKEHLKEYLKEYDKNRNKTEERKEAKKKYHEANKEKIREKKRIYREANKEKIREKKRIYMRNKRQKEKEN